MKLLEDYYFGCWSNTFFTGNKPFYLYRIAGLPIPMTKQDVEQELSKCPEVITFSIYSEEARKKLREFFEKQGLRVISPEVKPWLFPENPRIDPQSPPKILETTKECYVNVYWRDDMREVMGKLGKSGFKTCYRVGGGVVVK